MQLIPGSTERDLAEQVAQFALDPLSHAIYAYPWGEGELKGSTGPRKWQTDVLTCIRDHLGAKATRFTPLLLSVTSGHGVGKSALIAQVMKWAMDTCPDCKVVVTANTESQLRTKTWPEVSKWFRLAITSRWFDVTATAVAVRGDEAHQRTWRADAVPWSENNTEAFAGLHNKGKRILVIYDEASAIPDAIWQVTEGALTDSDTEIVWLAFGNPTRNTGRFRECFRQYRHRWRNWQIDAREVEGTNKEQIEKWRQDYGEESDFFKVRVRGVFPGMAPRQFISDADVDAAFGRQIHRTAYEWAPVVLSCDPAWTGGDEIVFGKRQGLAFHILQVMPKNDDDVLVANRLAQLEDEHRADAVFVDFGYGTGIVSIGHSMGRKWVLVPFGGASADPGCLNKRSEMWNSAKKWLKEGGCIPKDEVLRSDLLSPETVPRMDGKIALEPKDAMKARGLPSPNRADALALTFAQSVAKLPHNPWLDTPSGRFQRGEPERKAYDRLHHEHRRPR